MSDNVPAFRWSQNSLGGPRATSKLAYGPLGTDDLKKMGLVNGVCPAMGSMFCFTQCKNVPHGDCPVMNDSAVLAGENTTCGTPCQTCTLDCPCKVQAVIGVDLAEQEDRTVKHLVWWDGYCVTVREQS